MKGNEYLVQKLTRLITTRNIYHNFVDRMHFDDGWRAEQQALLFQAKIFSHDFS